MKTHIRLIASVRLNFFPSTRVPRTQEYQESAYGIALNDAGQQHGKASSISLS